MISKKLEQRLRDRTTQDLIEIRKIISDELTIRYDEMLDRDMMLRFFRTGETK